LLWNYLSTGEDIWSALKKAAKKEVETGKKIVVVFLLGCVLGACGSTGECIGRRGDGGGWAPRIENVYFGGTLCWVCVGSTGEGTDLLRCL
jgi:hypothetical protein